MHLPPLMIQLLRQQDNVIATWQVEQSTRVMRAAHNRGHWRRLAPNVYLASPSQPNERQRLWAAALYGGPGAVISGRCALVIAGWKGGVAWPADVLIRPGRDRRSGPAWVRTHRVQDLPQPRRRRPPACDPHLALVHATGWARSEREAMMIALSALQQRMVDPERVLTLITSNSPRSRTLRDMVREYTTGADSLSEVQFARLCRRHDVPAPVRQTRHVDSDGNLLYTDAEFRSASGRLVVVEIDGPQHLRPETWIKDMHRQNELVLTSGALVLRTSTIEVRINAGPFMQQLRSALLL